MSLELAVLIVLLMPVVYVVIPTVLNLALRILFWRRSGRSDRVFITFDDGPDPLQTPKILAELERSGVTAAFFMLGEKVERFPDIVAAVRSGGHEIGEHSYSHSFPWFTNPIRTLLDLTRCRKVMNETLGRDACTLFRPPFGKFNTITLLYALFGKKKNVFWNVDLSGFRKTDQAGPSRPSLADIKPGTVVLLHEAEGRELAKDLGTIETLRAILEDVSSKGIKTGNLRDLYES
jgi:peptidoglycan-N-acetylglucosamine deacetylase